LLLTNPPDLRYTLAMSIDKDILIDVLSEVFREAWDEKNPHQDPEIYTSCYTAFCEKRIKALLESIEDKID
jgi:2-phosphoglycerate kinase